MLIINRLAQRVTRSRRFNLAAKCAALAGSAPPSDSASEERVATSRLSIIVPVHDAPNVVSRCLTRLLRYSGNAQVIVVDDGSRLCETRSGLAGAQQRRPDWLFIQHPEPLGHSRACEAGVRLAQRDILCLLNSDAFVTSRSWAGVLGCFNDLRVAVAGPLTSSAPTSQQVPAANANRFRWKDEELDAFAECLTRPFRSRTPNPLLGKSTYRVELVNGFAFFVRRSVWSEMGGFDPLLRDYGNEDEFCKRALRAGYHLKVSRASYIHHLGKQSFGGEGESAERESESYRVQQRHFAEIHGKL